MHYLNMAFLIWMGQLHRQRSGNCYGLNRNRQLGNLYLGKRLVFSKYEQNFYAARIRSAAFSPIIMLGAFVFPDTCVGIIEASATLSPSTP